MKNFRTFYFCAMILFPPCLLIGGIGVGGGAPPSVSLETMSTLQARALDGDLIRIRDLGSDPVYLQADTENMTRTTLQAFVLPKGDKVKLFVEDPVDSAQRNLMLGMARTMRATMPGVLPILPTDITLKPKPIIDTVKVTDIDAGTLEKISATGAAE
ncbi:MAG TPA: hypothetical protein VE954_31850 [Oligoflexus sp.]|uniref:hypothetical protein n=1 Tax=Oligoflexus sp. TaxID=1971216 RepID=UPI002D283A01|nr:hypothetical protein [Oligoflexus sp.]HYX37719.1 hypothetical protein [Oligoflexus sp.]